MRALVARARDVLQRELSIARKGGPVIFATTVCVVAGAAGWTAVRPHAYRATATVAVGGPAGPTIPPQGQRRDDRAVETYVRTQAYLACSTAVLRRAAAGLGAARGGSKQPSSWGRSGGNPSASVNAPPALSIACRPSPRTAGHIDLTVEHVTPELAGELATAAARAFVALRGEQETADERVRSRAVAAMLEKASAAVAQARASLVAFEQRISAGGGSLSDRRGALRTQAMTLSRRRASLRAEQLIDTSRAPTSDPLADEAQRVRRIAVELAGLTRDHDRLALELAQAQRSYRWLEGERARHQAARLGRHLPELVAGAVAPQQPARPPATAALALALVIGVIGSRLALCFLPATSERSVPGPGSPLASRRATNPLSTVVRSMEQAIEILPCHLRNAEHFLELYDSDLEYGGLNCASARALPLGTRLVVEVTFPELPNPVLVRAIVVNQRSRTHAEHEAAVLVSFQPEEVAKRDFLLKVARRQIVAAPRRRHKRMPVDIPVRWSEAQSTESFAGSLREISAEGAQLVTAAEPQVGAAIRLFFDHPTHPDTAFVQGRVIYANRSCYGIRRCTLSDADGPDGQRRATTRRMVPS
jgi:hypothetical protein